MAIYMNGAGKRMGAEIGARIDAAALKTGAAPGWACSCSWSLMIAREGVETAFMIVAVARNEGNEALVAGALAGTALAAALAWAWLRWGRRVNLTLFFQATSIFLILFSLQLLLYAFHEFTEAEALPLDNTLLAHGHRGMGRGPLRPDLQRADGARCRSPGLQASRCARELHDAFFNRDSHPASLPGRQTQSDGRLQGGMQ